jgi:predicted anti-sigma-YlaC factor YlaD
MRFTVNRFSAHAGRWAGIFLIASFLLLSACSPRQAIMRGVADELASQGQAEEEDLELAREAGAFYLKLSESFLRQTPDHLALAEAVTSGFTQYAYAFVAGPADRIEAADAKAAQKLRERAARLYLRAQRHALAALETATPGFTAKLGEASADKWPVLTDAQVGVAYWGAAAWGGYISLSKDNPDVVADLPLAIRLARLAWARQPDYGDGALASLMGSFEVARPGGSRQRAIEYFDQGIAASHGKSAGAYLAKAEGIALPAGDRESFERLLRQAIVAAGSSRDLRNAVMRERAQWLLDNAPDLF